MGTVTKQGTISAHPTSYDTTNYSYASISSSYPMSNAYTDSSSTTYAQVSWKTGSSAETYVYLKFDFSAIPEGATIKSVSASAKGYVNTTNSSRVTTRQMQLAAGTTLKGAALTLSTSTSAQTFSSVGTWTRAELLTAGVRFYVKRGTSNTTSTYQLRMYGATMTVDYEYQETSYTITINNSTSVNVVASATEVVGGDNVEIIADSLSGITITDNGADVTSQFVNGLSDTITAVPGQSFTTGFSASGANFYQSSSSTGTDWLEYAIGHSAESPYSTSNTSNTYVKPEGDTGWINYQFDFSEIPSGATIKSVSVKVYGARENATVDTTHVARFQCYSGATAKGTLQNFTSTSNSLVTVSDPGTWTADELHNAQLRFEIGYYGGRMLGITWTVQYELSDYVYTIANVQSDHTIIVTSGGGEQMFVKVNGSWTAVSAVYMKVNGSWVQQSNLSNLFDTSANYVKGN